MQRQARDSETPKFREHRLFLRLRARALVRHDADVADRNSGADRHARPHAREDPATPPLCELCGLLSPAKEKKTAELRAGVMLCLGGAERHRKSPRLVRDPKGDEQRERGPILVDRCKVGLSLTRASSPSRCRLGGLRSSMFVHLCGIGGACGWRSHIRRYVQT